MLLALGESILSKTLTFSGEFFWLFNYESLGSKISFSIIPVTFISIAIYAFRWNEWMWGLKALPWVKCEFWWSIIAAITTGVGFIIILASTLSNFNNTAVEEEGIASSLICLFGELPL